MALLTEIVGLDTTKDTELQQLNESLHQIEQLLEWFPNMSQDDEAYTALDVAMKRLAAAKRGLGIVNKLKPGPYRGKHARRVMQNLNSIRKMIGDIQRQIQQSSTETESNSDNNY